MTHIESIKNNQMSLKVMQEDLNKWRQYLYNVNSSQINL